MPRSLCLDFFIRRSSRLERRVLGIKQDADIQQGMRVENREAIHECLGTIADANTATLAFEVTADVVIDGEVGTVRSIEFVEPPLELQDSDKDCLSAAMTEMSFDGLDVAFEGPVNYPFIVHGSAP